MNRDAVRDLLAYHRARLRAAKTRDAATRALDEMLTDIIDESLNSFELALTDLQVDDADIDEMLRTERDRMIGEKRAALDVLPPPLVH